MNNIDLKLNDIEGINVSLDVAVKKIEPPLEDLEVTPTKGQQTFNHENSYGYNNVVINPIPDEYIIPDGTLPITENTTYDVTKFAKVTASVHPAPYLQDKELTINENGTQNITADEGYDGLNQVSVTVNAIEDLTEELNTYNTELTEQETKIADVIELLQTKATPTAEKYAPRWIRLNSYKGTDLDYELNNLDTSNMTSMKLMLNACSNITSFNIPSWNTSNVTDMSYMFDTCSSLLSVNMKNLDASKVTTMEYMFYFSKKISSVDFTGTDTSSLTTVSNMFYNCDTTTSLEIKGLDTSNVTNMSYMFYGCKALKLLDIRSFVFSNVTNYSSMFNGVPSGCVVVVKGEGEKTWIKNKFSNVTPKTVAEYGG